MLLYYIESDRQYLYHYTPPETLLDTILLTRTLRLGPIGATNDPRESKDWIFQWGTNSEFGDMAGHEWKSLEAEATRIAKDMCKLTCLTMDGKDAVGLGINHIWDRGFCRSRMWAQYAANHTGACLVFDWAALRSSLVATVPQDSTLFEGGVEYRNRSQAQPLVNNPFILNFDAIRSVGLEVTVFHHIRHFWRELFFEKALDWAHEREFRWLLWDRAYADHVFDFGSSLKGVILGTSFPQVRIEELRPYKQSLQLEIGQLNWKNGVPEVVPAFWPP